MGGRCLPGGEHRSNPQILIDNHRDRKERQAVWRIRATYLVCVLGGSSSGIPDCQGRIGKE